MIETKLDESFPPIQFFRKDFEIRARKDRDRHSTDLIECQKKLNYQ